MVALLTTEQAEQLKGIEFVKDNFFNPIQNKNGNWIISIEEVEQCSIDWVKELPLIEFEPVIVEMNFLNS
jgi:hypothetical protein